MCNQIGELTYAINIYLSVVYRISVNLGREFSDIRLYETNNRCLLSISIYNVGCTRSVARCTASK